MKQLSRKSRYSMAIYAGLLWLFTIGFMLIGSINIYAKGHEKFKIALLLPASITDGGWNAFAYDGLKAIEKELGAKVSYIESRTPTDQEAHFRDYALDGYQLIFGHGFEYQESAKQVAPDFPETVFITSTGNTVTDNIAPIVFAIEEPVYLLGIIAGSMTQTNKIGIVGGQNISAINSMFSAFEEGAKSVNPEVLVRRAYVGNWSDIGKGKELAHAHINEDSDFLFPVADVAGLGVFQAAMEAQSDGKTVYTFGVYQDQSELSPTTIVASAIVTPKVFVKLAKVVMEGAFEPQPYRFTMAENEALTFVYNPALKDKVPETVQKAVEDAKTKIIAGELKVKQTYFTEKENQK
ncbi:BMP family protein [Candidatus Poribacteria bacterium]|nr:BMP family protein [Candidatus Poribacteria bacterium]